MKIERAIEILNPAHREHYESIEPVEEACRMELRRCRTAFGKNRNTFQRAPHPL